MIAFRLSSFTFRLLLLSALSALSAVNAFALEAPDSATVAADTAASPRPRPVSPRGAALRSIALPGWGQFCNGRPIKGGIMTAAYTASLAGIVVRQRQLDREARQPGFDPSQPRRNAFIFTTIGLMFYSAVDAYVDAHLGKDGQAAIALSLTPNGGVAVRLPFRMGK